MAPKLQPRITVIVDDELLRRMDKIAEKYGLKQHSNVVRQAICKWYYEIEKAEKNGRSRAE